MAGGESEIADDDSRTSPEGEDLVMSQPRGAHITAAFISFEAVDISSIFRTRASVMKSVPKFLKEPFKNCVKLALEEALAQEEDRQVRKWLEEARSPRSNCWTGLTDSIKANGPL